MRNTAENSWPCNTHTHTHTLGRDRQILQPVFISSVGLKKTRQDSASTAECPAPRPCVSIALCTVCGWYAGEKISAFVSDAHSLAFPGGTSSVSSHSQWQTNSTANLQQLRFASNQLNSSLPLQGGLGFAKRGTVLCPEAQLPAEHSWMWL